MSNRTKRVAQALKEEISKIIQEEIHDPRMGFITITGVNITSDLRFARVYYSILGTQQDKENTASALESAMGFIKRNIGSRLRLRYLPQIKFVLDDSGQYSLSIQKVLDKIKEQQQDRREK